LEYLIGKIEENIKNLEEVKLDFRRCPLIEKESIEEINEKFKAYSNVDFSLDWKKDFNQ